jgi:hypothetical protein
MRKIMRAAWAAMVLSVFVATIALIAGSALAQGGNSIEVNKDLARRYHQAYVTGDTELLSKLVAPDYVGHFNNLLAPPGLAGVQHKPPSFTPHFLMRNQQWIKFRTYAVARLCANVACSKPSNSVFEPAKNS